jgi:hypothetical protein
MAKPRILRPISSRRKTSMENRRDFLGTLAAIPLVAGALKAQGQGSPTDAEVFARLRADLLFPKDVTYCNTGTLGAVPREVMDALTNGL